METDDFIYMHILISAMKIYEIVTILERMVAAVCD